ncbi:PREDICTED: uncharacterized protein LOC104752502 [Camelina sativa]|uniref:Uncharacterized protein LOC104752502 n=1 Tax=Camelina sativa TaxID=90675 RepID=A0ABM0WLW1_CAMSA|nr:PREDICTED: uncharacterized protein LOC104752502 [Camelina sativa]
MFSVFAAAETGIFWDLDACPIPVHLTPASISDSFKLCLGNRGLRCKKMSIVAYSIEMVENAQDFESANIKLLQKAEKKHHEILVDVYDWILSHRGHLANLMVISDFAHTYLRYDTFKDLGENVLLAFPDDTIGCPWPLGIPSSVWLWSSLSSGGSPLNIQQIGIAQVGSTSLLRDLGKKATTLKNQIEIPQVGRSDDTSPLRDSTTTEQKKLGKKEKALKV